MNIPLEQLGADDLRILLQECDNSLELVCGMDTEDVEIIHALVAADELNDEVQKLLTDDPDTACRILWAALAALAASQTAVTIEAELLSRADRGVRS